MLIVQSRRGFALHEVLVLCSCAAIIVVFTTVVFAAPADDVKGARARHHLSMKEHTQVAQIMKVFTIFAQMQKDRYPIPGLINRKAADLDGDGIGDQQIAGVGPEDIALNTTASLYSSLLAQRYMKPDLLISQMERSKNVKEDKDYNYEAYNPAADTYWDSNFAADLKKLSNTSYAHLPIAGQRKAKMWRNNNKSPSPILGNRGPKGGNADPKSNTCSPFGYWDGYVAFSDGHLEFLRPAFAPPVIQVENVMDNIFKADGEDGIDTVLAFTKVMKEMKDGGPVLQYD